MKLHETVETPRHSTPQKPPEAAPPRAVSPSESASALAENAAPIGNFAANSNQNVAISSGEIIVAVPTETFSLAAFLHDSAAANMSETSFAPAASTRAVAEEFASSSDVRAENAGRRDAKNAAFKAAPPAEISAAREVAGAPRVLAQNRYLRMLGTLFWLPLIAMLLAYAWHPLSGGDDVWAHAAIGSWISGHGQVPRESLFLWGAPPIPWVWHSWLSQLFFFGLMRFGALFQSGGGPYAIAIFTAAIVALCFFLLWKNWRLHASSGSVCAMMFFAAIFAGVLRFRPRPELFTALFLVLLMLWLDAWWREKKSPETSSRDAKNPNASTRTILFRALFLMAMFALWANFHGAVLLGLVLLFATALCDAWQSRVDRKSQFLFLIALLCAAATLCNPFGIGVLMDSVQSARSGMFARIDEWKPPLIEAQLAPMIWCEIALVVIATIGWWRNPRKRLAHGVWLLLFFAMFLMQRRHLWILSLVCLAVGAANARFLSLGAAWQFCLRMLRQPPTLPSLPMRLAWRATLLFGLACAAGTTLEAQRGNLFPLRGVNSVPAGAARFVNAQKLRGRVFNDYENSSYLQWAWNGKTPSRPDENAIHFPSQARRALYIDLLNSYPPALLEEYLLIWNGGDAAQKRLDQRDVKIIIFGDDKRDRDITKWLNANAKWRRVYDRKDDGMVWVRATKTATAAKKAPTPREYSRPKKQANDLEKSRRGAL